MSIKEYMLELEEELKYLPKKRKENILNSYQAKINVEIDLGVKEEDIIKNLKTPQDISKEVYESLGINYLDRRKKKYQSDNIMVMIISIIALVFTLSFIVTASYLFISYIVDSFALIFMLTNTKDKVFVTILFALSYIVLFIILLFILDILILLFNALLEKILRPFNKVIKQIDFSIIDFIESIVKVKKLFKKLLIIFSILLVITFFCSFVSDTYIRRAYFNIEPSTNYQSKTIDEYQNKVIFKIDDASFSIKKGDSFTIESYSEFKKDIIVSNTSNTIISTEDIYRIGLFNFLKEPSPIFNITIPSNLDISIELNSGTINIEHELLNDVVIKQSYGNTYLNKLTCNSLNINNKETGIKIKECTNQHTKISSSNGLVELDNLKTSLIDINNGVADFKMSNSNIDTINFKVVNANNYLNHVTCNNLNVDISSGNFNIDSINATNALNIKSASNASFYLKNVKALNTSLITLSGNIILDYVESNTLAETGANCDISNCKGNLDVKCLGNFLTITLCNLDTLDVETNNAETLFKLIKANKINYIGMNSLNTFYSIFASEIIITDPAGKTHIDNYFEALSKEERELYVLYFKTIDKFERPINASYRDHENIVY